MSDPDPIPLELWRDLFRLASTLRKMEPWNWMPNGVDFALRMKPGSDETRLLAMLKLPGRFPIISLLPDWRSAYLISQIGGDAPFYDPVNIPQTNVLFGPDKLLAPRDLALMEKLGIEPSKTDSPLFRTLHDGRAPWFLSLAEAEIFRDALNQALGVALRSEEDGELIRPHRPDGVFTRLRDSSGKWTDSRVIPPPPPPRTVGAMPDQSKLDAVRAGKREIGCAQADLRATNVLLTAPNGQQSPAYQFLVVDALSRHVHLSAMIVPNNGVMAMWNSIPNILVDACIRLGGFPTEIQVANPRLQTILHQLTEHLHFRLTRMAKLEALEQVANDALKQLLDRTMKKKPQ